MNRRDRMREQILQHGFKLKRIFFDDPYSGIGPVELCKALHRIETKEHHRAEMECSQDYDIEWSEKQDQAVIDKLDKLLGFRARGIPVFLNGDPRGYALKIESEYVSEHNLDIYRDWGGYGILCPEFDGRE